MFVAIAAVSDASYVFLAGAIAPALRTASSTVRYGGYVAAGVYFGLGLYAALSSTRVPKQ